MSTPSVNEQPVSPALTRVKLWRTSARRGPSWSVEVAAGASEEEVDRLVELAFAADRKIAARAARPDPGAGE
jgi:hypothetical protein